MCVYVRVCVLCVCVGVCTCIKVCACSLLAFKDSLTHQSWFSRLSIQCFLFFPDGVCFITVLFIFPFSKQTSSLSLFMIWDVTGGPGAGGAGWGLLSLGPLLRF